MTAGAPVSVAGSGPPAGAGNALVAPAKINLTLEVVARLPSGYHAIRSVMIALPRLYDEIAVDDWRRGHAVEALERPERDPPLLFPVSRVSSQPEIGKEHDHAVVVCRCRR